MENFELQKEEKAVFMPTVVLNATTGKGYVHGDSYMEDPFSLYTYILTWITNYSKASSKSFEFDIKLSYMNSTSSRAILELLRGIHMLQEKGKSIKVNWMHPKPGEDHYDILENGEDFINESGIDMRLMEY